MTERQIDYFLNPGSTVLLSTPSYALYLAERMRQRGVSPGSIPLRLGCFGGEAGAEAAPTRKKIEDGLGIDAYDYYGLAEIGPTCASECREQAGIHWVEDHVLVETVNKETLRRCAPGEVGVLVLTHLTKEGTPMLRYWTNDYARLDFIRCACGRTHVRAVGGVLGRANDLIIYKGENFYPVQVEKVVRCFGELTDEYRIVIGTHEGTGADVVTVVAEYLDEALNTEELRASIRHALREELGVTPELELVGSGSLARTEFKAKRIEDRREKV
jgi:phenylacetate-CoA ligase